MVRSHRPSRFTKLLAAGVATGAVAASVGVAFTSGNGGVAAAASGWALRSATAANMVAGSYQPTAADAVNVAVGHDVVVATPKMFAPYVALMHHANPQLRLYAYTNGAFAKSEQGSTYPASWYLHDAAGKKVVSNQYGNFMMDTSNPGWIADRVNTCRTAVATSGYDGCMVDMLGPAPLEGGYLQSLPIDPATGVVYTADTLIATNSALAATIQSNLNGTPVIINGLSSGPRYFAGAQTSRLVAGTNGGIFEAWLRASSMSLDRFPTEKVWLQNVNAIVASEAQNRPAIAMTKTWGAGTAQQVDTWHKYAAASFLLATNGSSTFSFVAANTPAAVTADDPYSQIQLGAPQGPFAKVNGVYQRSFANGLVVVNPTTATVTLQLAHAYTTSDGRVVTSLVVAPNTGEILVG